MTEYIERQKIRDALYDADAITMRAVKIINQFPAADVVPVVRCGECKYSAIDFENRRYCKLVTYYNHVPDDWFCADGERKDGDVE